MIIADRVALIILIISGLNWGSIGVFQLDLIAWLCGGQTAIVSRIIYIVVGICAVWCISLLFRDRQPRKAVREIRHHG